MTPFQQRLNAILNFGVSTIIPTVIKNPASQATAGNYVAIGVGLISLVEAFFPAHPTVANPTVAPIVTPSTTA